MRRCIFSIILQYFDVLDKGVVSYGEDIVDGGGSITSVVEVGGSVRVFFREEDFHVLAPVAELVIPATPALHERGIEVS